MIHNGGAVYNSPSIISDHLLTKVSFTADSGYFDPTCL